MPRTHTLPDDVILERAMSFFWQNGYAGTSLRDLTQATELSSAALYHRFSDKDGLFVEALPHYAEEGLMERLGIANASLLRPDLDRLIGVLRIVIDKSYPIRGTHE